MIKFKCPECGCELFINLMIYNDGKLEIGGAWLTGSHLFSWIEVEYSDIQMARESIPVDIDICFYCGLALW